MFKWLSDRLRAFKSKLVPSRQDKAAPQLANFQLVFDLTKEPRPNLGLPPNAIPGLSVIKRLLRGLRYTELSHLIGLEIEIDSLEKLRNNLDKLLIEHKQPVASLLSEHPDVPFRKYGILDLAFEVLNTDHPIDRKPARFLKEMGFLPDRAEVDDAVFPDAGIGFLEEMLEQTQSGKLMLKLFLRSRGGYQGAKDRPVEEWLKMDLTKHFPCKFAIVDACITNCDLIWLNKHFYL